MKTSDFNFELPQELIAQTPIPRRDASRLLVLDKDTGAWEHRHFYDLPDYLRQLRIKLTVAAFFLQTDTQHFLRTELSDTDGQFV